MQEFLVWLRARHQMVMEMEGKARAMLAEGNRDAYVELMREKAELLAELAEEAEPYYPALSETERRKARSALGRFSAGAVTSLNLDSVFYMSALLYPDEHQPGQPDNLAKFIEELAVRS